MEQVDQTLSLGLHRTLKAFYGYDRFQPQQEVAIAATLSGKDCLLILPTGQVLAEQHAAEWAARVGLHISGGVAAGGGKSAAFQVAPLYRNQISVVVTPLLALGKDQVERCLELGIDAALWSSETTDNKKRLITCELTADFEDTSLRLLYTTPESLGKDELRWVVRWRRPLVASSLLVSSLQLSATIH